MRDPKRIDEFCNVLAQAWHKVPDWRFGQLFMNIPFKSDPWFIEDDEMLEIIRKEFGVPAEDNRKPIDMDEVTKAIGDGTIRFIPDPNEEVGTVAEIDGSWLRFGNTEDEMLPPDEYVTAVGGEEIAWRICEALFELQDNPDGQEEWNRFELAIRNTVTADD